MLIAIAGLLVTFSWLVLSFWYVEETVGFEGMLLLLPNEIGQFIIGVFAPIAFLWLILGFFHVAQRLRRLEDTMWHQQPVPRLQALPPPRAAAGTSYRAALHQGDSSTAAPVEPPQASAPARSSPTDSAPSDTPVSGIPPGIPSTAPPYPPLPPEAPDQAPARGGFAARLRSRLRERDGEAGSPRGDPLDRGLARINPFGASRRSTPEPPPAFDAVVGAREREASQESGTSRGESLRPEAPRPERPRTAFSRPAFSRPEAPRPDTPGRDTLGPDAPGSDALAPDPLPAGRGRAPLDPPRDRRDHAVPPPNTLSAEPPAAAPSKRRRPISRPAETDRPTADRRFRPSGSLDGTEAEDATRSDRPGRRPREEAAARLASRSAAEGTRLDGDLEPVPRPAADAARPRRPAAALSPDPFPSGSPTRPLATAATVVPEAPPAGPTAEAGAPDAGSGPTPSEPAAPARPPQRRSGAPEAAPSFAVPSDSAPTTQRPPASAAPAARTEPANPVPNTTPRVVASVTPLASSAEPNAPRPKDEAPGQRMVPPPIPAASSVAVKSPADSKATGPVAREADKGSADAAEPGPAPEAPPAKEAKVPPQAPPVAPPRVTPSPVASPPAEAERAGEARPIGFRHLVRITTLDLNTLAMDLSSALCKPGEHAKALKGYDRGEKDVFFDQVRGQIAGGDPENVRRRLVAGSALQHLDRYQDRFERLLHESRSIDVSGAVAKSLEAMAIGRLYGAIKTLREASGQDVA